MSSLDALVEVLETLMPEEVERQFEEEARVSRGEGVTSGASCFENCCRPQRESRLDLLIDALKQQMPPTVKMLIQEEQDRLDEELMECREELPDSSTSSLVSSIDDEDDDEVDSELGWSPHDDEFPVLENSSSDLQEPSNEEKFNEETDECHRETLDVLDNDGEAESLFDGHSGISWVYASN